VIWRFADGTELELGGVVRGETDLARALRVDVADVRRGYPPGVYRVAPGFEPLDLNDAELVSSWSLNVASLHDVEVLEAPDLGGAEPEDVREDVEY
jgi:hypothetical protein